MSKNKCLYCGSFSLRADRALSGRLICTNCGNPYGFRKVTRNQSIKNFRFKNTRKYLFIFILMLVFIFIVI